jgi:hypothetical protein
MTPDDYKPHLFEGESDLLRQEMAKASSYLEFGIGGSTLLAAEVGIRRIVSVDSDQAWVRKIDEKIAVNRPRFDIELIHCDIGQTRDWGFPVDRERIADWPQYFILPWQRFLSRRETPDLIYIDGRFRVACALYSLLNLHLHRSRLFRKAARLLIHDFSDRPYYDKILEFASVVAAVNTLVVVEPKRGVPQSRLLQELLSFQFDTR